MAKQTTRLMVLGIIAYRGPVSGYDIEQTLREWAVDRWATIAASSIYQQLRSLTTRGSIRSEANPSGRATEYRCTRGGREEFRDLLLSLLNETDFQPLSLLPLLHFTPSLTDTEITGGLKRRIAIIDEILAHEDQAISQAEKAGPSHVAEVFRLTWQGYSADRAWCQGFLERHGQRTRPTMG